LGRLDVPIEGSGKRPVVLNNQVVTPTQKGSVAANDHEANGSKSHPECFLPKWCPLGLTHTQRRKLQCLRLREKREKELEKQRDEVFNSYRLMVRTTGEGVESQDGAPDRGGQTARGGGSTAQGG
jgi:hypothetical protein